MALAQVEVVYGALVDMGEDRVEEPQELALLLFREKVGAFRVIDQIAKAPGRRRREPCAGRTAAPVRRYRAGLLQQVDIAVAELVAVPLDLELGPVDKRARIGALAIEIVRVAQEDDVPVRLAQEQSVEKCPSSNVGLIRESNRRP
ncbi:hypothetical protein [Thauera sp. SDU_THAU2]|uniref:hypothetical protein n=1 Tax=Thauera sp. SDU_THAU2 TaxID=3136633 RepID=UPI00311F3CB9